MTSEVEDGGAQAWPSHLAQGNLVWATQRSNWIKLRQKFHSLESLTWQTPSMAGKTVYFNHLLFTLLMKEGFLLQGYGNAQIICSPVIEQIWWADWWYILRVWVRRTLHVTRGHTGIVLQSTENRPESVGGRFYSIRRVGWPLVPKRGCDCLVGVIPWSGREQKPTTWGISRNCTQPPWEGGFFVKRTLTVGTEWRKTLAAGHSRPRSFTK